MIYGKLVTNNVKGAYHIFFGIIQIFTYLDLKLCDKKGAAYLAAPNNIVLIAATTVTAAAAGFSAFFTEVCNCIGWAKALATVAAINASFRNLQGRKGQATPQPMVITISTGGTLPTICDIYTFLYIILFI